jgi:hypothetical protein
MGLYDGRGAGINPMAIQQAMAESLRVWQTVKIVILAPGPNSVYFKTKDPAAFLWSGEARYQPYRKDIPIAQVTNPTTTGTARFQVDFTRDGVLPDIRTDYVVLIVPMAGVEYPDPFITQYVHTVTSAMNSSLAWVRTIETIVDTKQRENFAIQPDGSGGFEWVP